MAWPAIKKSFTVDQFREYVAGLQFKGWRPSKIVLHNTGAPSLKTYLGYTDGVGPNTTDAQWMSNLENYYKGLGWSGAPHLFISPKNILVFNSLMERGTHSPSWNGISWGIETIGDYSVEDDDTDLGLKVKKNMIAAAAILCEKAGIDPTTLLLHKQDPATTHDCPGRDMAQDKGAIIQAILEYMSDGGGEHPDIIPMVPSIMPAPVPTKPGWVVVPAGDHLKVRESSSVSSKEVGRLENNAMVAIAGAVMNGKTKWLRIKDGWVAARFVSLEDPSKLTPPVPLPTPAAPSGRKIVIMQRGLGGGPTTMRFSLGLDTLSAEAAKRPGVESYVYEHTEDHLALQDALDAAREKVDIILGGHSLGALSAAQLALKLYQKGIRVRLLFLFDSTWNAPAPDIEGNVDVAIAYYGTSFLSPLGHDRIEAGATFKGRMENIPIWVLHQNVDDDQGAHTRFLSELDKIR